MNSQQKIINILTICRKAGKLVIGFDAVKEAVIESGASLVAVTEDISANTLKEIRFFCQRTGTDVIELGISSEDILYAVGKQTVTAAICDYGFATRIRRLCEDEKTVSKKNKSNSGTNVPDDSHK